MRLLCIHAKLAQISQTMRAGGNQLVALYFRVSAEVGKYVRTAGFSHAGVSEYPRGLNYSKS